MKIIMVLSFMYCCISNANNNIYSTDWNVDQIYPTEASWNNEVSKVENLIIEINDLSKHEVTNASQLAQIMQLVSKARSTAGKLAKVGLLQSFIDTSSDAYSKRMQQGQKLEMLVESTVSFLQPLILSIEESSLKAWMNTPELKASKNRILRTLFLKAYSSEISANKLLPEVGKLSLVMADLYGKVVSNNTFWPTTEINGNNEIISPAKFKSLIRDSKTTINKDQLDHLFYQRAAELIDIFGLSLTNRIQSQTSIAKAHNLITASEWLLTLNDGFLPGTQNKFFDLIIELKPEVTKTIQALGQLRGEEIKTYYDLFNVKTTDDMTIKVNDAFDEIVSLSDVFGQNYITLLTERLKEPWIHLGLSENKSNSVGVFWQIGNTLAHSLLPYTSDYKSARHLSASVLLMMGYRSADGDNKPDKREEDFPVLSNAIWYLGKQLFDQHWLTIKKDHKERTISIETQLVTFIRIVYKGAMIAEFEELINERLNNNEILNGDDVSEIYAMMLKKYFGDTGVEMPEHLKYEWINHGTMFYGPHYISWAMSKYLALGLHEKILNKDVHAIKAVTNGMGVSQMHFSREVLENSEINMFNDDFLQLVIQRLKAIRSY